MDKKIVGYTAGVFDLFHIGHVNHLMNAKSMCDHLIVGVSSDKMIEKKGKKTAIPYDQRVDVVRSCRYVDSVIAQEDFDRFKMWERLKFDITFIGDDYFDDKKFREIEKKLKKAGVKVIYFPYTKNVSSTLVKSFLQSKGNWTKDDEKNNKINNKEYGEEFKFENEESENEDIEKEFDFNKNYKEIY